MPMPDNAFYQRQGLVIHVNYGNLSIIEFTLLVTKTKTENLQMIRIIEMVD